MTTPNTYSLRQYKPAAFLSILFSFAWICGPQLWSQVVFNEIVASNGTIIADEDGDFEDWAELLNTGTSPINLDGWGISDDPSSPFRWVFPEVTINPGQYLMVWLSGKDRESGPFLHTNFSLNVQGEPMSLTRPDGTLADALEPVSIPRDTSFGRVPDGTGEWYFFLNPTPGSANTSQGFNAPTPPPSFSVERGFYDQAFELTLSTGDPEATIRYTTNGSAPTATVGMIYNAPIQVHTTAVVRAVAIKTGALPINSVVTHSYIFPDDVINQPYDPAALGFPATWGSWNLVHYGMNPVVTQDPAYAPRMIEALTSIPTLSLVIDMNDMFSASTGLYANRWRRGEAWERPVSMELIHPFQPSADYQVNAGLRTQGGASRDQENTPKSSFRLMFKSQYGPSSLTYPFFQSSGWDQADFNTIVLRADWNNSWLHPSFFTPNDDQRDRGLYMRDRFIRDLQIDISDAGSRSNHVHLYINGVYWGLYNPSERVDAYFASTYFGGAREEWDVITHDILGSGGVETGVRDGDRIAYDEMMTLARSGLATLEKYEALQQYLNIPQFIDYMLLNLWSGNIDWPHNNWTGVRRREPGAGFLFFCWDAEWTMVELYENNIHVNFGPAELFQRLRANPEFKMLFADHVHRHFFNGGILTPEQLIPRFEATALEVESAVIAESARWGNYYLDTNPADPWDWGLTYELHTYNDHWLPEYNRMRNEYLPQRTAVVLNQFRHPTVGLYPQIAAPAFIPHGANWDSTSPVVISAPQGVIYYTSDGSDPRVYGSGAVSATALSYTHPLTFAEPTKLKSRALHNGIWSALNEADYIPPAPTPHDLSAGSYFFAGWPADSAVGTYPPNMIFDQTQQADPSLLIEMDGEWQLPYNLTSRSRINGLGENGISFINTGNAQDIEGAGYVGAARLALNTTGQHTIRVRWTAGTRTPNNRVYGMRLQYRIGATGVFQDVTDSTGMPYEYLRNSTAGHYNRFGPVTLPPEAQNQPRIELRWKYYHVSGSSGARAEIFLDDISVTAGEVAGSYTEWVLNNYPDPVDANDPLISGHPEDPGNSGINNLQRFAFGMDATTRSHDKLPRIQKVGTATQLIFPIPANQIGVAYVVEFSPDLSDWTQVLWDSQSDPVILDEDGNAQIALPDAYPGSSGFVRVKLVPLVSP